MKKVHLFQCRLRYLLLFMLLLGSISVHSQGTILEGNQYSEYSIIRNYKNNVDITYNVMLDTQTFNYVDRVSMTTLSVNILNSFDVSDFVVFHDSVFFCGSVDQTAIFGYFDIQDVFLNNSGSIEYYKLFYPTTFDDTRSVLFSLGKIDVTTSHSGATHMLMTGWGYAYNNNTKNSSNNNKGYYYPGVIVESWIDSLNNRKIKYTIDLNYNYLYSDVAFTDNYAVITAPSTEENLPNSHNYFYYKNPISTNKGYLDCYVIPPSSISYTPIMTAAPSSLQVYPSGSMIHITNMGNDMFATACTNDPNNLITVSIYQDPIQQPINRFEIPNTTFCRDLVYNSRQNSLYVLNVPPDGELYQINSPFSVSLRLKEGNSYWLSLDNTDNESRVIVSGFDPSTVFVYKKNYWLFDHHNLISNCFMPVYFHNNNLYMLDNANSYRQVIANCPSQFNRILPEKTSYNITIKCP